MDIIYHWVPLPRPQPPLPCNYAIQEMNHSIYISEEATIETQIYTAQQVVPLQHVWIDISQVSQPSKYDIIVDIFFY